MRMVPAVIGCLVLFVFTLRRIRYRVNASRIKSYMEQANIRMRILSSGGGILYQFPGAAGLPPEMKRILLDAGPDGYLDESTGIRYTYSSIREGMAVCEDDVSSFLQVKEELAQTGRKLEHTAQFLAGENAIRKNLLSAEYRQELIRSLENRMHERASALSEEIRRLPDAEDRGKILARIVLYLCCIKRSCNFFFLTREKTPVSFDELRVYLSELTGLAMEGGARIAVHCACDGTIDVNRAGLVYDICFALCLDALERTPDSVIMQVARTPEAFRVTVMTEQSKPFTAPSSLLEAIRKQHVTQSEEVNEEMAFTVFTIPAEDSR